MLSLNATPSVKFLLIIQIKVIYISFELWYNFIFVWLLSIMLFIALYLHKLYIVLCTLHVLSVLISLLLCVKYN